MSLTPTQLQELQTIVLDLGEEFPHNADALWNAAIRMQTGDLGPVTGSGGLPAFEAAVADIKLCQEEVQNYQQRQGSPSSGFDVAVLQVVPPTSTFPSGNVGEIVYLETAPNSYVATDQIVIDPVGPNSVQMDEVGTTVFRTVPAASGGIEINNLSTGAGFERVLTTADLGGGVASLTGGININLTGTATDPIVNLDAAITGVSVDGVTLNAVGAATNYLDESGAYSVPVGAGGGGAAGSAPWIYDNTIAGPADPGANEFRTSTGNPISVTAFYFNDADANGLDIQNLIDTAFVGSQLVMRNADDNTQVRVYTITGITNNVGWYQVNVDYLFGNGDASIPNGTEILFEFYNTANVEGGTDVANRNDIIYWEGSSNRWQAAGSLININPLTPPLGGRLQLGTTSGYSTTSPQIMRPLGAADTVMDFVYGTDPNNGFLQGYRRSTAPDEMIFGARIASANTDMLLLTLNNEVLVEPATTFRLGERGTANADKAGYGQLWVNSADDSLNYQTEAGVNFDLTSDVGIVATPTPAANEVVIWDSTGATVAGDPNLTWDGTDLDIIGAGGLVITNGADAVALRVATDINLTAAGAPDLNITGVVAINAGTVDADFDNLTATDFNGVALTTGGVATNFLNETGAYSVPPAAAVTELEDSGGNVRLEALTLGLLELRSVANLDTEQRILNFTHQDGTIRASIGQLAATNDFRITNSVTNGAFEVSLGGTGMYRIEPDPNTAFDLTRHQFDDDNGNLVFTMGVTAVNDVGMGAQVADDGGTLYPVGMNVLPPKLANSGRQYNLSDNGKMVYKNSGVLVIMNMPTVMTVLPNGWTIGVANLGSAGDLRISPLTGNMNHIAADGTITTITFGSTWELSPGFIGTLWKESDTESWLWGNDAITGL